MLNSRIRYLPMIGVVLLALFLRLRGLDTTGLWGDQAFTLNTAMRWVNGGPLPLAANKASVGFVNPPLIEYLYGAALRLWPGPAPDILSVSLLTLLGGLAAVVVTGAVTARLFGRRAGLWAMLAFAAAPWAVFWSQLIWNQTMVPPFAALALGGLLLYLFDRPRAVYLLGSFAAAAAMIQVHPGAAVQLGALGLALALHWRRVRPAHLLAAAAIFALLFLPYLLYQIGTGWADLATVRALAGQPARLSGAAVLLSLDLLRAQGLYRAVPGVALFDALAVGLLVAALAGVLWIVGRGWHARAAGGQRAGAVVALDGVAGDETWRALGVVLLWLVVPVLFYLRTSVYLQNYYLIGQWPAQFIILGAGLAAAQRGAILPNRAMRNAIRENRATGWLVALPMVALLAFQVFFSLRYQDARAAGDGPPLQVRHARTLIAQSRQLLAERPACHLVGLGHGAQVETSDLALLVEFTDPARVLLADGDLALPLPSPCAVTLDARPGSRASYVLAAEAQPIPGVGVTVKGQTWTFYDWAEGPRGETTGAPRWDAVLLVGTFTGQPTPGRDLTLALTWEALARPPVAYHFGAYLLDAANNIVAQHDGPGFDSAQWRAGDRFVTFQPLPVPAALPPGDYRAAVALYTWPDIIRVPLAGGTDTATVAAWAVSGE